MSELTKENAGDEAFLTLIHELVRAYQAFSLYEAAGYQGMALTPAQAAVIFALGHTSGMSLKEIGERTVITKGTLTGIVDRLEAKKLVVRVPHATDRRSTVVKLTSGGEAVFATQFPRQVAYLKQRFGRLSKKERKAAIAALKTIRSLFE
ncbi:MAG: MarR family transcriptional regulator [Gammaproteobacteria bacterium]|nr:MarR family transcriptional regulator [Gammaproteobacteria bacterium]